MIHIRYGNVDDSRAFLALMKVAFAQHRGKIQPESSVFRETVDTIRTKLEKQTLLLAYDPTAGEKPVGCVVCYPREGQFYLGRLAVDPTHRGRGIAKLLVQRVEDEATRLGYQSIFLEVRIALKGNIAFFENCGYKITTSHAHEGFDMPTFYRLEKQLELP